jgi:amidohydrolase
LSTRRTKILKDIATLYGCHRSEVEKVVRHIHSTPELSGQETQACAWQAALLTRWGFNVETAYKGINTAYKATYGKGVPHVCFMAEYDALPGIGHGCGHHLVAGVALGAGILVKKIMERHGVAGAVTVMGTPAEEQQGCKIDLIRAGALMGIDAALMAHPSNYPTCQSLEESGIIQMMVRFKGRTAHAAEAPEKGANALDAVRLMFNGVDAWRQQLPETCRVHGVIREGGLAPNIIPDAAAAEFYLRDFDPDVLSAMRDRFEKIAQGAALMTDTSVEIKEIPNAFRPGRPNGQLNNLFMELAGEAGMAPQWLGRSRSSSDFGDVTWEVPAMQAYFNITRDDPSIVLHSKEFTQCAISDYALSQMGKTAIILAQMAIMFITNDELRSRVQKTFCSNASLKQR